MSKALKLISVFIPTYNGEKYIHECITKLINQKPPKGYQIEILVIDSGSKDNTVNILKSFGGDITLKEIPNNEFGHGKTRQYAAEIAKGEFILFLTQDATPASYNWAREMVEPFFISEKVGAVFGRQIPRPDSAPTIKREVATVFANFGPEDSIMLHSYFSFIDNKVLEARNTFFSDVNSAVRRELLLNDIPFRDLKYAEDQALADDMQRKGLIKAYSARGAVWHSNEYTAKQFFNRKFDEYRGLVDSIAYSEKPRRKSMLLGWIRPTFQDYKFILKDRDYPLISKAYWALLSPVFNINSQRGKYYGLKYANDKQKGKKFSLEEKNK